MFQKACRSAAIRITLVSIFGVLGIVSHLQALNLDVVTFPEKKSVKLAFRLSERAPRAVLEAKVRLTEGQAQIKINFRDMKPAVLFGGDITCYVVWAVTRDSSVMNLGELWMTDSRGEAEFSTGLKAFALMITAEPYSLVEKPSELIVAVNGAPGKTKVPSEQFAFEGLVDAADHIQENIVDIAWDSATPLDLMQAEKAFELAQRSDAEEYAPGIMRSARVALAQAKNLVGKKKQRLDYSRRSIAAASDAIQITERRKEAEELQRQIETRREEMQALEERARLAEEALVTSQASMTEAEKQRAAAEALVAENRNILKGLSGEKELLLSSLKTMREESARLRQEREQLSNRLKGALSEVAETRDSARGFIVNLPDILFDVDKAALKPEAKLVLAKLAGILLIMPELNLRVEGHTDSQGSEDYNQTLSENRAASVERFLAENSIAGERMKAVGYGENRPVADNTTKEGRQENRRVEIIIAEGEIAEGRESSTE